jgi:tetratricopeptide (TPR) repeat protein
LVVALAALALTTPAGAEWHRAQSEHFIIYSDDEPRRLTEFATRLEKFDKAVRLVRGMDDPPLTDSRRLTIYALPNSGAVSKLAGSSYVRGFYSGRADGSVAFVPRRSGGGDWWDIDAEAIFFHEYAHHLQLQYSSMALPVWFTEGFAEFFATAEVKRDGSVLVGAQPGYRVWSFFNDAARLSLEQVLGETYGQLNAAEIDKLYGYGWLLTHYLSFEPSRKGQLARYVQAIQTGMSPLDSARSAFGDLKTLDRQVERYKLAKRLTGIEVDKKALSVGPVKVRKLRAGEATAMDLHIRSRRGVTREIAPPIAADARKIAKLYPDDPFVQEVLAEAEFDTENYAAAEAAADRALASNPNSVNALLYKGRAQMEQARRNPEKADWAGIRQWFLKANKLDTENALPLALFYQSFGAARQRPTKNAVDGLLYAAALAPQDDGLRVVAFQQLLSERRLAEAKRMFAPIAYKPHASAKWRETSGKIMAAINRGDSDEALKVMTESASEPTEEATKS